MGRIGHGFLQYMASIAKWCCIKRTVPAVRLTIRNFPASLSALCRFSSVFCSPCALSPDNSPETRENGAGALKPLLQVPCASIFHLGTESPSAVARASRRTAVAPDPFNGRQRTVDISTLGSLVRPGIRTATQNTDKPCRTLSAWGRTAGCRDTLFVRL